ncbi:porin family protein [Sphingomonas sp. RB3P16]|uniref:outer membrane protein n=1 Tax=Parasphingomonas frigoris TaxID=3096163 RepID=UPI002FC96768
MFPQFSRRKAFVRSVQRLSERHIVKQSLFIAGILIATPIAATAQERQSAEPQVADAPATPAFSGFKFGSGVAYQWTTADYALPSIKSSIATKKHELGYRLHIGYDAQIGNVLVVGAEAGVGRGGATLTAARDLGKYSLKPGWSWDVSGRAGVLAAPSVLLYGRAGYSWLRVKEQTDFSAVAGSDLDIRSTRKGFLFGGGIEAKVTHRSFVRAEYNRSNYRNGLKSSKVLIALASKF